MLIEIVEPSPMYELLAPALIQLEWARRRLADALLGRDDLRACAGIGSPLPEIRFEATSGALCGTRLVIHGSFADCERPWRRASESCAGFVFQSFEWQSICQETIGAARRTEPHIAVLSDAQDRVLLVLPIGIEHHRGLRVLRFLGDVVTDYGAPLIEPGFAAAITPDETARLWSSVCRLLPPVDLVWLRRMPDSIDGVANPMTTLPGAAHAEDAFAATLPASMAEFRKTHRVNWPDTRRRRRRLAEHGAVAFEIAETPAARQEALARLAQDKSRRWRETGARDLFAEPGYLEFYRAVTETPLPDGNVQIAALRLDGRIVAAHWGVVLGRRFYYLVPAYDAAWQDYSVGRLLLEHLIEACIDDPDIAIFDLTAGGEAYKHQWTDHTVPLYELLEPVTLPGRVYVAERRLREVLKRRYPASRNFVRRLRGKRPIEGSSGGARPS